jgi:hypothetical protein
MRVNFVHPNEGVKRMNGQDPTSALTTGFDAPDREISVEEVAQTAAMEAVNAEIPVSSVQVSEPATQAAGPIPAAPIAPAPLPFPIILRRVSGRYLSPASGFQLELRVDVDGQRPMKMLSGDFYQISGATKTYFGSFIVKSPSITVTSANVVVKGLGQYTWSAGAPVVQVTIARRTIFQPPAPATVQFFTTGGSPGATYNCAFDSVYFRSVRIETDRVSDVATPVFATYNTGSLLSGGPARNLSVVGAFAESGIELVPTTGSNVVNISEAAGNAKWSNAELHASMEKHFTLWKEIPQWAVWLVVAQDHDIGPGLLGIMFDQKGKQRQGCAVFHRGLGGTTAEKLRLQLQTYVHELGHCFNMLHSWQKSFANPPGINRPASLSYMNYPWGFPGGEAQFWKNFPFQFDDGEVQHLRHAFRNNIVMGGNDFIIGAGLEHPEILGTPVRDDSGLRLQISAPASFALGEPVVIKLNLGATDTRGKTAHDYLHPNFGQVQVAIRKPDGRVVAYEPLISHCVAGRETYLDANTQAEDSAYIGYGKDGFYFDQSGIYRIRAVYTALDGSTVVSNILNLRVRYPVTAADEDLADLYFGEDQGTLLYLLGSDSEYLASGRTAFTKVVDKYPTNPMANYARLVLGVNASREFKTIVEDRETRLLVRKPNTDSCIQNLTAAVDSNVLDSITTDMAAMLLADVQATYGDDKGAAETRKKVRKAAAAAKRATGS